MRPTGFTPISLNYEPITPPPSVSSLESGSVETLNSKVLIPGELVLSTPVSRADTDNDRSFVINASIDKAFVQPGESFKVSCNITDPLGGNVSGIPLILRMSKITEGLEDLQDLAFSSSTDSTGFCIISGLVGSNSQSGVKYRLAVQVLEEDSLPSLLLDESSFNSLLNTSNLLVLTTVVSAQSGDLTSNPPIPEGVPVIPLHDVVVTTSTYVFRTYVLDQELDISSANPSPRGSSGSAIYSDLDIPSPYTSGIHNKSPIEAIQNLIGSAFDELERIQSWADEILGKAHSLASLLENSEVGVIKDLVPEGLSAAIDRYQAAIEEAGKYAADTAETYHSDYANGNTVYKSNAVEQHNVGQMRTQTSSTYSVNSPSITLSSQQSVTQSRFEHHAGDLLQASHIHYWIRAEDQYTCIANTAARYNQSELVEHSANLTQASGNAVYYSDKEFIQVGQASNVPYHPTNSNTIQGYGTSTKIVQRDIKQKSILGSIVNHAGDSIYHQATNAIGMQANTVRLNAASGDASVYSSSKASFRGESKASLDSSGLVTMDGSIALINCSRQSSISLPIPKIIAELPRTFAPMKTVAEYPRSAPVSPGGRAVRGSKTPEPATTPVDTNVGNWLTRHAPNSKHTPDER